MQPSTTQPINFKQLVRDFQYDIERVTIRKRGTTYDEARQAVFNLLYYTSPDGIKPWEERLLGYLCQYDLHIIDTYILDCLRAVITGRTRIGGIGYNTTLPLGITIQRGIGKNVRSNFERTPEVLHHYVTCYRLRQVRNILAAQIPNLYDYYSVEQVTRILLNLEDVNFMYFDSEVNVADHFMDAIFDTPMRRCSICGELMQVGYYLGNAYACSDECRRAYYKQAPYNAQSDDDADREYYYECYDVYMDFISKEDWMKMPVEQCKNYREETGDQAYYTEWI